MTPATTTEKLQALATLNPNVHAMRRVDASQIDLYVHLAGVKFDTNNLSDKALENIGIMFARYFES